MASNENGTLVSGSGSEEQKERNKIYSRCSRVAYYTGVFSFENFAVGIGNVMSSGNFPWGTALNIIAAVLGAVACLFPYLVVRANTTKPPGAVVKGFLGCMAKLFRLWCVLSLVTVLIFAILTAAMGLAECNNRHEYANDLYLNRCTPDPKNLHQLSILDIVMFLLLSVFLAITTYYSFRHKEVLKLRRPD